MSNTVTREHRSVSRRPGAAAPSNAQGTDETPEAAKGRGRGRLFKSKKFLIVLVAVLLVGGGGAYKFAIPHPPAAPVGGEFVPMDPMTLNLAGGHYLKLAVSIQLVKGKAVAADFDTSHAAELVIDEFSNRSVSSLDSNPARKRLTAQLLTSVQKAYPGEVYDIFLTQFVTQ